MQNILQQTLHPFILAFVVFTLTAFPSIKSLMLLVGQCSLLKLNVLISLPNLKVVAFQ